MQLGVRHDRAAGAQDSSDSEVLELDEVGEGRASEPTAATFSPSWPEPDEELLLLLLLLLLPISMGAAAAGLSSPSSCKA